MTHAFEFEGHPWAREYMNTLLTDYLRPLAEDPSATARGARLGTFAGRIKDNLSASGHMLELMMSPQQRAVFQQLQALMALMEGCSNHVMQRVGTVHLKDHEVLRTTFESRARNRGAGERLFIKLTGLDVKLEQYALGERFCQQVVDARGIEFLNRVWEGPSTSPPWRRSPPRSAGSPARRPSSYDRRERPGGGHDSPAGAPHPHRRRPARHGRRAAGRAARLGAPPATTGA